MFEVEGFSSELDIQYLRSWIVTLYRIGLTLTSAAARFVDFDIGHNNRESLKGFPVGKIIYRLTRARRYL